MITQTILKTFVLGWVKQFALGKLESFADDPRPDIKTQLPIIGGWWFVWLKRKGAASPESGARKLVALSLKGSDFQFWFKKVT